MRRTLVALSLVAGMLGLGTTASVGLMAAYPGQAFAQLNAVLNGVVADVESEVPELPVPRLP